MFSEWGTRNNYCQSKYLSEQGNNFHSHLAGNVTRTKSMKKTEDFTLYTCGSNGPWSVKYIPYNSQM